MDNGYRIPAHILYEICQRNRYMIVRHKSGAEVGINCKIAGMAAKRHRFDTHTLTQYVSYKSCDLMEYLTHKIPF